MNQVTSYQCPNCTGPLHFDEALGKLKCDYCEGVFTTEEIQELYESSSNSENPKEALREKEADFWDTSQMKKDWGTKGEELAAYSCPSCGAQLVCERNTAATSCPYCGNPSIISEQLRGLLKPDYVIPFQVSRKQAISALKEHYKGKLLLPRAFRRENHIQEIKGIYVPFWLFDGTADADVTFHATKTHVHRQADEEVTITEHYNVRRAATVSFEKIPVDASAKMPDAYMDAIEPFDYRQMKEFSEAYLPGFLANTYDVPVGECFARADERAVETAYRVMEDSVKGYMGKVCVNKDIRLKRGQVKYALLPVWILTTKWKGKNFLFAINGQTGRMAGDLPVSLGIWLALFSAITISLTAILSMIAMV